MQDEIKQAMAYLALEKARLTGRLQVVWQLDDDLPLNTPVPTLIIQPIIENAIIHGIAPLAEGGTLKIVMRQEDGEIVTQIADNGAGFDVDTLHPKLASQPLAVHASSDIGKQRPAIGLSNVNQRLLLLYGEAYRLEITSWVGIGTTVTIKFPLPENQKSAQLETPDRS